MFREYLEKGKVWVDKVASAVMNYTEMETKVREATNDEPWGPHGKILNDLTRETYDSENVVELMTALLHRIFPENPYNWRRVYKGLFVLAHLLRNGSETVCNIARDNLYTLRTLETYQCIDERGRDQGASIRIKAHDVVELLQDSEFLNAERQKAFSSQKVYAGIGSGDMYGYRYSGDNGPQNNYGGDSDGDNNYHFPSRAPPRAEMPWNCGGGGASDEKKDLQIHPSHRLGSFDSWKTGRERSIADDVADKFSEVLKVAKAVTNDFLGKPRVPPPSNYEEDPHKVSEEVFAFPDAIIEAPDELNHRAYKRETATPPIIHRLPASPTQPKSEPSVASFEELNSDPLIDFGNSQGSIAIDKSPTMLPRAPSMELPTSPSKTGKSEESMDLFAELVNRKNGQPKCITTDLFSICNPANTASTPATSTSPPAQDADFGDFSSFKTTSGPINSPSSVPLNTATDRFMEFPLSPLQANVTPIVSAPVAVSAKTSSLKAGLPVPDPRPQRVEGESQNDTNPSSSKSHPSVVGNTWRDFSTFDLELDLKSNKKTHPKSTAASLSQLQSLKQHRVNIQSTSQPLSTGTLKDTKSADSQTFAIFN